MLNAFEKMIKHLKKTFKNPSEYPLLVAFLVGSTVGVFSFPFVSLPFSIISSGFWGLFSFSMLISHKLKVEIHHSVSYPETHGNSDKARAFQDGARAAQSYSAYFKSCFLFRDWKHSEHFFAGYKRAIHDEREYKRTGSYPKY